MNQPEAAADTATLLLCSAGRRVELLEALREAASKRLGPCSRVLATDLQPERSAACAVADAAFALPRVTAPGYIDALLTLCLQQSVSVVIPTIDAELLPLAHARPAFEAAGVHVVISEPELVANCRDKRRTAALFSAIGLPAPALLDPEALTYPCFLKPVSGSCSQGVRAVAGPDSLSERERLDQTSIFQELIPPDWQEYTVDAWFGRNGSLRAMVPRERLEARGGEISKGIPRRDAVMHLLRPCLERLRGACGCLTVQVFASPDR